MESSSTRNETSSIVYTRSCKTMSRDANCEIPVYAPNLDGLQSGQCLVEAKDVLLASVKWEKWAGTMSGSNPALYGTDCVDGVHDKAGWSMQTSVEDSGCLKLSEFVVWPFLLADNVQIQLAYRSPSLPYNSLPIKGLRSCAWTPARSPRLGLPLVRLSSP